MELNTYQQEAGSLAEYPKLNGLVYTGLKLAGEAGEYADKLGKFYRGDGDLPVEALAYELGDTLWYIQECAFLLGYTLEDIATMNLKKLYDRKLRGKIKGDGDTR